MKYVRPSISVEFVTDFGTDGLVGTIGARFIDNDGNTVLARTTAGIIEYPANSGIYQINLTSPATAGEYSIVWDDGDDHWSVEDFTVTTGTVAPPVGVPSTDFGPCTGWITGDDVAECCSAEVGSDTSVMDESALAAQELLFQLSGRILTGVCTATVRPCRTQTCGCDWQVLSRGHIVWSGDVWTCDEATPCGCRGLSRVRLAGYPVREITEVKIDGSVVDPDTYRLDESRYLTRVRDPAEPDVVLLWPSCQSLDLDDTEEGTFSVTYEWGQDVPFLGIEAAKELACQIYLSCSNGADCKLPAGTTRMTRQGITIERRSFQFDRKNRTWSTGLAMVDAFLNSVNPNGLRRRPAIWSPAQHLAYARPVGS